jgi:alkylation response protein AidB-like acyl-CoA dehydrogenase
LAGHTETAVERRAGTSPARIAPPAPLAAADAVAPLAESLAPQTERDRALPPELVEALRDHGLFALCLPRVLGGGEAEPAQMVLALERLARADASCSWCAMIASTSSVLGAYLPSAVAERVYAHGRSVTGGVFAPRGRARRLEGGYRVDGRWPFASGVGHCDWVTGGCVVTGGDDEQAGPPEARLLLMPRDNVTVIDTWTVSGLSGTGSHDMTVEDELVPADLAVAPASEPPRHDGALYAFPLFGLLALGIAAVALGIGRGALADIVDLATAKTPSASSRTLAERPNIQFAVARAEARLRAARALLLDEAEAAFAEALESGPISIERRAGLRLAATHATRTAAGVVDVAYDAGGGTSIYATSPLQRRFRDVHVATQHMMVSPASFELAGRLLLGLPTDVSQL